MTGIASAWRRWRPTAFIGGLGLSGLAAIVLILAMYFSNTAPRLPSSIEALETLSTSRSWVRAVSVRPLNRAAPVTAAATPQNLGLVRHAPTSSDGPPIDISDLPPPNRHPIR